MERLIGSGWLVDCIIALTVVEAAGLLVYHRVTGRGLAPGDYLLNLASGLALLLALRGALGHTDWTWIALGLTAGGLAHGTDIWLRWRRARPLASPASR
jgi:hypothetical protein